MKERKEQSLGIPVSYQIQICWLSTCAINYIIIQLYFIFSSIFLPGSFINEILVSRVYRFSISFNPISILLYFLSLLFQASSYSPQFYLPFFYFLYSFFQAIIMKPKLKQKNIQSFLQDIDDFQFGEKQKFNLQQHLTPPDIAAKLLFHIYQTQPIHLYTVADIGVGTGMLMCGCIYLQAKYVIGFQIDNDYIHQTREMLDQKVEGAEYDLILANIRNLKMRQNSNLVDMVVMNPPFGTKDSGIDMVFLQFAMKICTGNIYSMHKSSTRKFIQKFCEERGYQMQVLFQVKFPLKKRFKGYHKKQVAFTEVDILKIKPTAKRIEQRKKLEELKEQLDKLPAD